MATQNKVGNRMNESKIDNRMNESKIDNRMNESALESYVSQHIQNNIDNGNLFSRVTGWYFEPKSFERSGKLYEKLGVKKFQRLYLATFGKIYSSLSGGDRWVRDSSREELKYWKKFTQICEGIHFIGNLLFIPLLINSCVGGNYDTAVCATLTNTLTDIYPIMLQRYNRTRICNILDKKEEKELRKLKESKLEAE